jgi:hypothetical protein
VNENLKARNKKLSLETVFGPNGQRSWLNPKGEAGADIKQGVKVGFLGGLLGIFYNVPAGSILSMPNADVLSRSIVGGIGAAGSAVAIPPVIKESQRSFEASVEALVQKGKIRLSKEAQTDSKARRKEIERIALKEMNARIGMASSIKATHPLPLAGTGAVILAAEKLGIPRPYVQTAYMALAPVMHNFLRLIYTGREKFWTIPQRMKKLEKLVYSSQNQPLSEQQAQRMDQAFLSRSDTWMSKGLTNSFTAILTGSVLLAAEVLCFADSRKKHQPDKSSKRPDPLNKGISPLDEAMPNRLPHQDVLRSGLVANPPNPWPSRAPLIAQPAPWNAYAQPVVSSVGLPTTPPGAFTLPQYPLLPAAWYPFAVTGFNRNASR